jgi:gas vesicle protein
LTRHLDANDSTIAKTLTQHFGEQSPLFRMLSPSQSDGILAGISQALATALQAQREHIVGQFSLDNKESALSRLVAELRDVNGSLRQNLLQVIDELAKKNQDFQSDVRTTLETFKARREEAARSTTHGVDFEKAVEAMVAPLAQQWGDVFEDTAHKTGSKPYCKTGDHVITLGPESAAPNSRIVIEAKEDKSYDAVKARAEIQEGRENRKAQVGVFVFSKTTAPPEMQPFLRFGQDILVVWDREDVNTDVFLKAALSLARALLVRERAHDEQIKADLNQLDAVIQIMNKDVEILADVLTWAGTIKNNSQKILDKVEKVRDNLDKQVETLKEHLAALGQEEGERNSS